MNPLVHQIQTFQESDDLSDKIRNWLGSMSSDSLSFITWRNHPFASDILLRNENLLLIYRAVSFCILFISMVYSVTIGWGAFSLYYHNWSLIFMVVSEFGLLLSSLTKVFPDEVFQVYRWILEISLGEE